MNTKIAFLGALAAIGLSAGVAGAAPQQVPQQQLALQPMPTATPHDSYDAYEANINPSAIGTTGPYDLADKYIGLTSFPLAGWSQINNPPS